ncbi:hypothetical protein [Nocardioides pelophilus]|uniref:hypothetical protein n=1 Tax=Nocardioides pelophilus TaxID=2172019 RepID=UPI001600DF92|nr:hypothetical protein [Nocardioides pelophilus]
MPADHGQRRGLSHEDAGTDLTGGTGQRAVQLGKAVTRSTGKDKRGAQRGPHVTLPIPIPADSSKPRGVAKVRQGRCGLTPIP